MRAIRKINNNVAICVDGSGSELIAMGRGIGFGQLPRELSLKEIERTFYDVDKQYIDTIRDLPTDVIEFSAGIIDIARNELPYELGPNAFLLLADHISFLLERLRRNIHVKMPLTYDVQQMYPAEYRIARYTLGRINKTFSVDCPQNEAVGIAINLLNARVSEDEVQTPSAALAAQYETMLEDITEIVEEHFHIIVDRNSFNFSRYATHLQYLFQRITQNATIQSDNLSLYRGLREEFPQVAACVDKVDILLQQRWHCTLSEEERLYLMLHINRICTKEGL